ncbi:MAG: sensor domain-containing protein [Acidimicrobiales bacterium]
MPSGTLRRDGKGELQSGPTPRGAETANGAVADVGHASAQGPSLRRRKPAAGPAVAPALGTASLNSVRAKLQEAAERYFWLFEDSPLAMYVCDTMGEVLEVNSALCRLLGRPPEEVVGRTMGSFAVDEPLEASELSDFLDGRARSYSNVRRYRASDGRVVPARVTLRAARDKNGRARTIFGEVEDITAEHLASEATDLLRRRLEMAVEASGIAIWELDLASGLVTVDEREPGPSLSSAGRVGHQRMTYAAFVRRLHPEDRRHMPSIKDVRCEPNFDIDRDVRLHEVPDGPRWVHLKGRALPTGNGGLPRVMGTIAPVDEARLASLEANRIPPQVMEASLDAFIGASLDAITTQWSSAAEAMFGWFAEEVVGQDFVERICSPAGAVGLRRLLVELEGAVPGHGLVVRGQVEAKSRDGRLFPVEVSAARAEGESGPMCGLFLRDLSERKAYEAQLVRDALFDPLSGLPNRALLVDRLGGALGRLSRAAGLLAVLVVDVDRFKIVNDGLGQRAGDDLLVQFGRRLRSVLRPADTVARVGGDEFVVLCEALDSEREAVALAERVQGVLAEPFVVAGYQRQDVYVSASVGVALATSSTAAAEDIVREAEIALRRAKEHGGGWVEVFDAESQRRSVAHLETEAQLRRALERSELCVYYQPMVDLTGQLQEVEALVRWVHPSGRLALPSEFVPLAEETGLIVPVGEMVLQMACEQAVRWRLAHPELSGLGVSVNVSGAQLRRAGAVERMASIIEDSGLPPGALTLEITESVLMDERTDAPGKLAFLRSLGVRLAMDDFGTGYSSLLYLRRYPLDVLKIDQSFVAGLVDNPQDAAIVEAVVRLGHSLGLRTVAEGVETAEQLQLLHDLRCDMGQGYFWGRPLPPEHLVGYALGA